MPFGEFLEAHGDIVPAGVPVDLATAGLNPATTAGVWADLTRYNRVTIVLFKALCAAAEDPTIKLQQATDRDGAGAKDLLYTRYATKSGLVGALINVKTWTKSTQTAATQTALTGFGVKETLCVIDITSDMLDANGGFGFVNAAIADPGNTAQLGCMLYVMSEPRDAKNAQTTPGIS